jgi:hypothetical protein
MAVHQPGSSHARHGRLRRHDPPVGPAHPAALGAPLPALPNRYAVPQFTPDAAYLFPTTNAGRAYRWDVRPSSWTRHACAVAGRPLGPTERKDVLPERDYAPGLHAMTRPRQGDKKGSKSHLPIATVRA